MSKYSDKFEKYIVHTMLPSVVSNDKGSGNLPQVLEEDNV